jgi:hypothetical protein
MKSKVKVSPQQAVETYRGVRHTVPHFQGSRLTGGGEIVSLTLRLRFTHQENFWYSFQLEAE